MQLLVAFDPTACGPGSLRVNDPTVCPVPPIPPTPPASRGIGGGGAAGDEWIDPQCHPPEVFVTAADAEMVVYATRAEVKVTARGAVMRVTIPGDDDDGR